MAARRQETAVVLPTRWFPVIAGPCGHTTLTSSTLTRTDSRRYGRVIQSQKGRSTTAEKRHGECDFFSADPSALRRMFCAVNAVSHQHPGTSRATGLEASQGNGQTAAQQAVQADWHACPATPSTETMRWKRDTTPIKAVHTKGLNVSLLGTSEGLGRISTLKLLCNPRGRRRGIRVAPCA